mmetsp:Transcript_7569/g.17351  ORF Transcript_7569/g.17351 Transcript_7569/m.17351 type:complete len:81 (+) Transcript_7569:719-961(+)
MARAGHQGVSRFEMAREEEIYRPRSGAQQVLAQTGMDAWEDERANVADRAYGHPRGASMCMQGCCGVDVNALLMQSDELL